MTNSPRPIDFPEVADLLAAATAPASAAELAGEAAALSSFRGGTAASGSWTRRPRRILASKAALATIGALGLLSVGGAAAATGSLPDPAQDAAHGALTRVGLEVPRGKGLATAPGQLKKAAEDKAAKAKGKAAKDKDKAAKEHAPEADEPAPPAEKADQGQGGTISSIAHDPALAGADKGAAVSGAASDGKSHAGQEHGEPPHPTPPASSPGNTAPGRATASTAGPRGPVAPAHP